MIDWNSVSTVFLDMDGTLLDLHFDNHFWLEIIPQRYGKKHGCDLEQAKKEVYGRYNSVKGTLQWYCIDYWTAELQLDIVALKSEFAHMVCVHPHVFSFLKAIRDNDKRLVLLTNAHFKSVNLKLARTDLAKHFDRIIISHELGEPKESDQFWRLLSQHEPHDPATTLLIDDNLAVLQAARNKGIAHVIAIKRPDTRGCDIDSGDFRAIRDFREILPPSIPYNVLT